jgi:HEAT repeat protein
VIGNVCKNFASDLETAIVNLLDNTEHEGTVVRWSAAFALGEILKLKTSHNENLVPAIESICERETQNSIRKIYLAALKKIQK